MLTGDEYIMYQLESLHNAGIAQIPIELTYDTDFDDFYNYSANTDWIKAVTQPGNASNHFLNLFGGNEKNRYYGSVNYLDQKGTIINTGYNRLLSRLNFEHYFTEKLILGLRIHHTYNKFDGNVSPNYRDILEVAFTKAPNVSPWEFDAVGNPTGDYFVTDWNFQGNENFNPLAVSEEGNTRIVSNELVTTAQLQYDLPDWLSFRESFTFTRSTADLNSYLPHSALGNLWSGPYMDNRSDIGINQYRNEIQSVVKIPFKDPKKNMLNGTFTWIRQDRTYSAETVTISTLGRNSVTGIKDAVVSSIVYQLNDRYLWNFNSRFESFENADNKWDKHFGVSTGWRFSEESFFKKIHFLNTGLIHAGWSYSEYHPILEFPSYRILIRIPYEVYTISNIELWQTQSYHAGLKLGLFKDKIHFTTDIYSRKTAIDSDFGLEVLKRKNYGWECFLEYNAIETNKLNWTMQFNIAQTHSKVMEVTDDPDFESWGNGSYRSYLFKNKAEGSIYGFVHEGVYPDDQDAVALDPDGNILYDDGGTPVLMSYGGYTFKGGDAKYKDMNYDGIIDKDDMVYLGNSYPKYTGGFGSTLQFKNVSLTCNFHYRSGYQVINQAAMESEGLISYNNQSKEVLNRWRIQGQEGTELLPRAFRNHPANNLGSDKYIGNGGFIRMNHISLGYDFTPEICKKIHLKDLSLSLSAQRLFTLSNYDGLDPEIEMESNGWHRDEVRVYPPKIYTLSIQITI